MFRIIIIPINDCDIFNSLANVDTVHVIISDDIAINPVVIPNFPNNFFI